MWKYNPDPFRLSLCWNRKLQLFSFLPSWWRLLKMKKFKFSVSTHSEIEMNRDHIFTHMGHREELPLPKSQPQSLTSEWDRWQSSQNLATKIRQIFCETLLRETRLYGCNWRLWVRLGSSFWALIRLICPGVHVSLMHFPAVGTWENSKTWVFACTKFRSSRSYSLREEGRGWGGLWVQHR